jgi:hypothetical protein
MVKAKNKKNRSKSHVHRYKDRLSEADGVYFLKLIVVVILSTLWLKLATPLSWHGIPMGGFPIGAMVTLVAIRLLEKNPYDRKIWFAVLVMVTILSYFVPAGIVI